MNVMDAMMAHRASFTPNDELIYQHIMRDPEQVATLTTTALAQQCDVSQPALTRFVKSVGYARYQDFRVDLIAWLAEQKLAQPADGGLDGHFAQLSGALNRLRDQIGEDGLTDLAAWVLSFERVFATGVAKSFQPAQLLEQLMIKSGRMFRAVETGYLPELADALTERDLIIIFSVGQNQDVFGPLTNTLGQMLLCTATASGALSSAATRQLTFPSASSNPEEGSVSPILFDVFVELLVKELVKRLG